METEELRRNLRELHFTAEMQQLRFSPWMDMSDTKSFSYGPTSLLEYASRR